MVAYRDMAVMETIKLMRECHDFGNTRLAGHAHRAQQGEMRRRRSR
jgi:hypothetical protein